MSFRKTTIAEIANPAPRSIAIGPFGSSLKADMYTSSGVPVVRGQNLTSANEIDLSDAVYVAPETAARFPACMLEEGDLVFPHRGAIGRVGLVGETPALLSSSMMKLKCDQSKADPRFVLYYFRGPGRRELMMRASTVGTPGIGQPLTSLREIPIHLPSIQEQRNIARILGSLDEKVAANVNLAAGADDLALALFANAARNAEYSSSTFADIARVSGGGTPSTKIPDYWGGDVSWATPTDITALVGPYLESTSRMITSEGLAACSSDLFAPGAILMTSRATIGAFAVNQIPAAVNQGFIVIEPHDKSLTNWILHDMRSRVDEFISMANGATFLELSRGNFKKFRNRTADEETMRNFGAQAEALHASARQALQENRMLSELRDTLLPELMSGRLRVKDAEKKIEEVV